MTPETKSIRGRNTIRFRMLRDDNRIQLDLNRDLNIDKILLGSKALQYTRELNAVFVDFPMGLESGREYSIDFYYSGAPKRVGRFGGISFDTDPAGFIKTALDVATDAGLGIDLHVDETLDPACLLYTSPSPRDGLLSRMPSSA